MEIFSLIFKIQISLLILLCFVLWLQTQGYICRKPISSSTERDVDASKKREIHHFDGRNLFAQDTRCTTTLNSDGFPGFHFKDANFMHGGIEDQSSSKIFVRALLVRNSKKKTNHSKQGQTLVKGNNTIILTFKIITTIEEQRGATRNPTNEFIVVDHVLDTASRQHLRLLNPYVFKLTRAQITQLYGLKLLQVVNAEAKELVFATLKRNNSECDVTSNSYSCGFATNLHERAVVPNQGFCCACHGENQRKNWIKRHDHLKNTQEYAETRSKTAVDKKRHERHFFGKMDTQNGGDNQREISRMVDTRQKARSELCQTNSKAEGEPEAQEKQTTVHCLKFSELWYEIYSIETSTINQSMAVQVFQKGVTTDGNLKWTNILNGGTVNFTSTNASVISNGVYFEYNSVNCNALSLAASKLILVPQRASVKLRGGSYFPRRENVDEYLVVNEDDITPRGNACSKIGVGHKAFLQQTNRCEQPQGSCLEMQPLHLWRMDREAMKAGKRGKYFLKFYAQAATNLTEHDVNNKQLKFIELKLNEPHTSFLNVQLHVNDNAFILIGNNASITEVYSDNTAGYLVTITAKVTNTGIVLGRFSTQIKDCTLLDNAQWTSDSNGLVTIPPQMEHIFKFKMMIQTRIKKIHCSVEVRNGKRSLVAIRRTQIERKKQCLCLFYCECICFANQTALTCRPMSKDHQHATGFVQQTTRTFKIPDEYPRRTWNDTNFTWPIIPVSIVMGLVVLGIFKALGGLCFPKIAVWGIDAVMSHPRFLKKYYEPHLRDRIVVHDCTGWPVNPNTFRRDVQVLKSSYQLTLNIFFFPIYFFYLFVVKPTRFITLIVLKCWKNVCPVQYNENDRNVVGWIYRPFLGDDCTCSPKQDCVCLEGVNDIYYNESSGKNSTEDIKASMINASHSAIYTGESENEDVNYVKLQVRHSAMSLRDMLRANNKKYKQ